MNSDQEIKIYEKNPYYWQYQGKPILLRGGSLEDNLFQIPELKKQLDLIAEKGGNYVRNTMSSRDPGNLWPFKKVEGSFDLEQWNPKYWKRLDTFLQETAARDIIVQLELWATFDYYRENWNQKNPFNPVNNSTYSAEETNLPPQVNSHPAETENNFFWSVPSADNQEKVLYYQQKFIDKILSYTFEYGHILYCMDNETSVTPAWGEYWSRYLKDKARDQDKKIYTTEMWDAWDLSHSQHDNTFNHPEVYDFVDISQNNHNSGEKHFNNALKQRRRIKNNPRPLNNVKIYGGFGDYGSIKDGVERFWRNIFAGAASVRFHRPDSGIGINKKAQQMLESLRDLLEEFNIFEAVPSSQFIHEKNKEAYLLYDNKGMFVIYFPQGGSIKLDISSTQPVLSSDSLKIKWYDIETSSWSKNQSKTGRKDIIEISTPAEGQWAVVIK